MRLRHQALIAVGCLGLGGCARLLGALVAPQEAAMSAASQVASTASAPAQAELAGVGRELDRLLAGKAANQAELQRLKDALDAKVRAATERKGAAQDDPERLRPWHPRVPTEKPRLGRRDPGDELRMGRPEPARALPPAGPLPDGIAAGELPTPLDLTRVRTGPPR